MQDFRNLGLNEDLLNGISQLGFENPTPVQKLVIPVALESTTDIIALAQTGTGKTAAFGLPLIQLIDPTIKNVQALVLCPTRELCVQVSEDLTRYSKFSHHCKVVAVYGGANIAPQITKIKAGAQIIVATPGRLIDLLERRAVSLEHLSRLVLDEADEMLNMGFKEALDTILESVKNKKSVWLFSATMSREIRAIAQNYMDSPQELSVGGRNETNQDIEHVYYVCRSDDRYATLKRIVDGNPGIYGLIFCRTKAETKEIADQMTIDGYNSDALHGDLSQSERDRVMNRFREGTLQLLIATDVAARGIDVEGITHVIHYGLPDDIEVYTHRSGRTGRAGRKGVSMAVVSTKFQFRIRDVERMTKCKFTQLPIPTGKEVCAQQLLSIMHNIKEQTIQQTEIEPFMPQIMEELQDLSKEELIIRFASVEFNRFLTYYKNAPDLNIRPKTGVKFERSDRRDSNMGSSRIYQRLFVNIGDMDGVTRKDFVRLLSGDMGIPSSAIGVIDIKQSFLHFDIEATYEQVIKDEFSHLVVNGRAVRVDNATARQGDGGGGGGRRDFKDSYKGGGGGYKGGKDKKDKDKDKKKKKW